MRAEPLISGKFVIFLEEDDHAVGKLDALGLRRMEAGQRWESESVASWQLAMSPALLTPADSIWLTESPKGCACFSLRTSLVGRALFG